MTILSFLSFCPFRHYGQNGQFGQLKRFVYCRRILSDIGPTTVHLQSNPRPLTLQSRHHFSTITDVFVP